jgi:hypothetical protein
MLLTLKELAEIYPDIGINKLKKWVSEDYRNLKKISVKENKLRMIDSERFHIWYKAHVFEKRNPMAFRVKGSSINQSSVDKYLNYIERTSRKGVREV